MSGTHPAIVPAKQNRTNQRKRVATIIWRIDQVISTTVMQKPLLQQDIDASVSD